MTLEHSTKYNLVFSIRKSLYDRLNALAVLLGCKDVTELFLFALEIHISKVYQDLRDPTVSEGLNSEGLELRDALIEVICAPRVKATAPTRSLNTSQIESKTFIGPIDRYVKTNKDFQAFIRKREREAQARTRKYKRQLEGHGRPKKPLTEQDESLLKDLHEKRY